MEALCKLFDPQATEVKVFGTSYKVSRTIPRLRLAAVNTVPALSSEDLAKNPDAVNGSHFVLLALVKVKDGTETVAVEIDPMNVNAKKCHPNTKTVVQQANVTPHDWVVGWSKGMSAILDMSVTDVPVLQKKEMTECGVWVLMMAYWIMAILLKKVDLDKAVKAVLEVNGDVSPFRRYIQ